MNFVKKTAVAIGALLASSVAASAADMDTPLSYWSGFYVGAQVGAGANVSDFLCEGDCDDILLDTSLNNILAGGYVGYNYQIDRFVVGVEGDLSAAFGRDDFDYNLWPAIDSGYRIEQDYYASIRARFGYLVTDSFLAFATIGWAFADYTMDNPCGDCSDWDNTTFIKGDRDAFVVGGGLEYALSESVHLKGEYLYADFGTSTLTLCDEGCTDFRTDLENHQVRVGLSYNF